MSQYIVSARKYRPDSFETLIGQDNIARTLKNSILRGQLAHAYLFCGPRGVGKTSTARIFAKTINCSNPSAEMEPCGECESCLSFKEGRSYCIHEMDAASNNGIEDMKALMDKVQIPPQVGKYSVYIIDEVHMLSTAAFNAFLKTLEEPPAHAIFILCTTEKHKILPTILSRCQTYDFSRIGVTDMVYNLRSIAQKEGVNIDDESLHIIAQKADGAMRDALTIFDQTVAFCGTDVKYADVMHNLNVLDYEYDFKLIDAALRGDYATALMTFDEILKKGFNAQYFVSAVGGHLRDLLVSRTGGLDTLLDLPESLKKRYEEQAAQCSVAFIYEALNIMTQCEAGYRAASNQRLHIEFALMKLCFINSKPATVAAPAPQPVAAPQPVPAPQAAPTPAPQPAAAPAPQSVAPTPSPAPQPVAPSPKPAAKTGFSLSNLMKAPEAKVAASASDNVSAELPSDEVLKEKWLELADMNSGRPRLANALRSAKVEIAQIEDYKQLSFQVANEAQQKWILEQLLTTLEKDIRRMTGSDKIRLEVTVAPVEESQSVVYLPEDKAKIIMNNNPEVVELISDLGLDIK